MAKGPGTPCRSGLKDMGKGKCTTPKWLARPCQSNGAGFSALKACAMPGSNSGNANDRFGAGFGACDLAEGKKGPVLVVNKKKEFLNDLVFAQTEG